MNPKEEALPDASRSRMTQTALLLAAIQALLILGVLLSVLGFPHRDFGVPLRFNNDSLQYQVISKSTLDTGWWWRANPRLSAPFAFRGVAYPVNGNVDQAVVWAVSRYTSRPGLAINAAWFVMVAPDGLLRRGGRHAN